MNSNFNMMEDYSYGDYASFEDLAGGKPSRRKKRRVLCDESKDSDLKNKSKPTKLFLEIWPHDTIGDLKKKLEAQGIPREEQDRLIFDGQQLDDNQTVESCSIDNGAKMHLVLKNN
eukprot:TRINITY_DN26383_c0_g1_i1.p1 TRINITY_DN26383_c0_g1~~TRINITY_DN26383_c0_g1_i1.p1  ORF type:complete len:116 (-),score=25.20 TRINITY_DN26383_c0_g1_i1:143-490(-)